MVSYTEKKMKKVGVNRQKIVLVTVLTQKNTLLIKCQFVNLSKIMITLNMRRSVQMINTGCKAIVLSSSLENGIGPRKGSVGYISKNPALKEIFYNKRSDCFAQPTQITFTRYGFEEKQRVETKLFINAMPIELDWFQKYLNIEQTSSIKNEDRNIDRQIKSIQTNIRTDPEFWNRMKNMVTSRFGRSNVHVGILVPIPNTNLDLPTMDKNEFEAWFRSYTINYTFRQNVFALREINTDRMEDLISMTYIDYIKDALINKKAYQTSLMSIISNHARRTELIKTIRKIVLIGETRNWIKERNTFKNWSITDNMMRPHSMDYCLKTVLRNFYSDANLKWKTDIIAKTQRKSIYVLINHVLKIRKRLSYLAQSLENRRNS